uniref:Uncharacterized protein n=1 Tax=viral metagenome TaxID=1070528 RepID=A0A6M3M4G4_9ZZZZ
MISIWESYPAQNVETYAPIALPILAGGITDTIYCPFCRDMWIQVDIAGMTSGESVTGRIEGSLDGTSWDTIQTSVNPTGADIVVTTNGATLIPVRDSLPPYVRASGFTTTNEDTEATIALQFHVASMV